MRMCLPPNPGGGPQPSCRGGGEVSARPPMWVFFVRFPSADAAKEARDIVRGRLVTYTGQGNVKHTLHVARGRLGAIGMLLLSNPTRRPSPPSPNL